LKAIVVFTDEGMVLRKLLKPGFRHVFVCIVNNGSWIYIDYVARFPVFLWMGPEDVDLAEIYRDMGYTVVETETRSKPVRFPFMVRDCVSMVKSVLSISSFALTPYGLYRRLVK